MTVITIGRNEDNDIVIRDTKVSRYHLQIIIDNNGEYSAVDLNSANGTYVNGQKISDEIKIQSGDSIRIGDTELPWMEYIHPNSDNRKNSNRSGKSSKRMICNRFVITLIILLGTIILGVGSYYVFQTFYAEKKISKKTTCARSNEAQLFNEAELSASEAKLLQEEADQLWREAMITKNDNDRKFAEKKQLEADEAKKRALKAKEDKEAAVKAAEDEIRTIKAEADASLMAANQKHDSEVRHIQEEAKKSIASANHARDIAQENASLTTEFYSEFSEMSDAIASEVCKSLNLQLNEKIEAKSALKNLFDKGDNKLKNKVLNTIHNIKKQSSKPDKKKNKGDKKTEDAMATIH